MAGRLFSLSLFLSAPALAQEPPPAAPSAVIADPADTPWPGGAIALDVDATDVTRGVFHVTQTIPLAPGTRAVTLLYPQWHPGKHAPRGAISELVALTVAADGKPVEWRRDWRDVNAFHVTVPEGAPALVARFLNTTPVRREEGRIVTTPDMLNLQWEKVSLYPAGHYVRQIRVRPTVTFPPEWRAATSLDGQQAGSGNRVTWAETDYETLVDSPVFAGRWFRRWDLGNSLALNVVADEPEQLDAKPETLAAMKALGAEALALFGRAPYERYEFLVALSDRLGDIGLEHLRSTEIALSPRTFLDWQGTDWDHGVLAHELVHAWNGKYRRPEGLWTPDYRQPMRADMLWLYEGQTQFWGWVLAARSGVQRKDTVLGMIASVAGSYSSMAGRNWRSVGDTTLDPVIAARRPKPFASLARGEDYYNEAALLWLEADQLIRAGTRGARGLDDFARAFFAWKGEPGRLSTYRPEDVIAALGEVYSHDWETFLAERIERSGRPAPLAGIEKAGYRLAWRSEPNSYDRARMAASGALGLEHSLGLTLSRDGAVAAVQWDSPAFNAGIVNGMRILAVDGAVFSAERMRAAVAATAGSQRTIELLAQRGDRVQTLPVTYAGGLRYPWLEPAGKGAAGLDRLLTAKRRAR